MPTILLAVRLVLIVNATASSFTARRKVVIEKALSAGHHLEVFETGRRGHAARIARGAANDGVDVVVVLAGDGTLNEAADGLVGTDTALAPLPGGSTNVYARTIGVSRDPVDATAQLLGSLDRRTFRRVGLGRVNSRHFLFHTGVGFDASVVEQVERKAAFKRYAAHPIFVGAAFDTWLRTYDHSRGRFTVTLDDGEVIDGGTLAILSKTSPYTYLGGTPIVVAPETNLDSSLSITVVKARHAPAMMSIAATALLSPKRLHGRRDVEHRANITGATIAGNTPFPYQMDGDYLGEVNQLAVAFVPDALNIVVP